MFNTKTADQLQCGDIVHYGLVTIVEPLDSGKVQLTFSTGHTELFSADAQFLVFDELGDLRAMIPPSVLALPNAPHRTSENRAILRGDG